MYNLELDLLVLLLDEVLCNGRISINMKGRLFGHLHQLATVDICHHHKDDFHDDEGDCPISLVPSA